MSFKRDSTVYLIRTTHLWPISCAMVKAVLSPLSSLMLQLLAGLHTPPCFAIPGGGGEGRGGEERGGEGRGGEGRGGEGRGGEGRGGEGRGGEGRGGEREYVITN